MGCRGNGRGMKYALFICVEEGVRPTDDQRQAIPYAVAAWIADTTARGIRVGGWQLAPTDESTTVRVRDGALWRESGSFADPARRIAGLNILECADQREALEVARQHPVAAFGTVELRRLDE